MDGLIILNKSKGMTSFTAVNIIHKLLREKAGHAGTLDPMAEGVLIVLLGRYTKKAKDFESSEKEYFAEVTFGVETDTLDATGKTLTTRPVQFTEEKLKEVLNGFRGEIEQIPPMVSAIHHKGQRLYELARKGITVERDPRKVTIHKLELVSFSGNKAELLVSCSKGTYIRSLCADIGEALGCGAHMSKLIRTKSGIYSIEKSMSLDQVASMYNKGIIESAICRI